jgi:hypothetical protein
MDKKERKEERKKERGTLLIDGCQNNSALHVSM